MLQALSRDVVTNQICGYVHIGQTRRRANYVEINMRKLKTHMHQQSAAVTLEARDKLRMYRFIVEVGVANGAVLSFLLLDDSIIANIISLEIQRFGESLSIHDRICNTT